MGILCEIIEQKKKRLKDAKARVTVRDLRTKIGNSEQPGDFQSVIKRSPFDDEDRRFYLDALQRYKNKYGISILAYCLMSNHIHILAVPERETSLAREI